MWWLLACAPLVRVQRALAPERFVTPEAPVGRYASVAVDRGWADLPVAPYRPDEAFVRDGVRWVEPVELTDRAQITVTPNQPDVTVDLFARHTGLVQRDFQAMESRSGSLPGVVATTIRFVPDGPLTEPMVIDLRDLVNPYGDDRLSDGDLLMVEVGDGGDPDRYLFRMYDYGWRTRLGAGVLFRVPVPYLEEPAALPPALTASLAVGYRARAHGAVLDFLEDRLMFVGSVGIGSTTFLGTTGLNQRLSGAFDATVVGGGVELYGLVSVQLLGNASAPFRDDVEMDWALAIGFDAVQAARFADQLGSRLLRDHPLAEDRRR